MKTPTLEEQVERIVEMVTIVFGYNVSDEKKSMARTLINTETIKKILLTAEKRGEAKYPQWTDGQQAYEEGVKIGVTAGVNRSKGRIPCTPEDPCGCHDGEVEHADGKCSCEVVEEIVEAITNITKQHD